MRGLLVQLAGEDDFAFQDTALDARMTGLVQARAAIEDIESTAPRHWAIVEQQNGRRSRRMCGRPRWAEAYSLGSRKMLLEEIQ